MKPSEFLAYEFLKYEANELTWPDFLRSIIPVFEKHGEDTETFEEFLHIMETTSYPAEKQSYQVVEIHCSYASEIEAAKLS